MATEDQWISIMRGAGDGVPAKARTTKKVNITVNGNTTVASSVDLPPGADFRGITLDTPVAITGTPTTCNFRAGTSAAGQQIVADVDAKAQGHIAATIVAALDKGGMAATAKTTVFFQVTTSGGSSSAGVIEVFVEYDAPVF